MLLWRSLPHIPEYRFDIVSGPSAEQMAVGDPVIGRLVTTKPRRFWLPGISTTKDALLTVDAEKQPPVRLETNKPVPTLTMNQMVGSLTLGAIQDGVFWPSDGLSVIPVIVEGEYPGLSLRLSLVEEPNTVRHL